MMSRIFSLLVGATLFFMMADRVIAQETGRAAKAVPAKTVNSELNDAFKRIERLEAQIAEMQVVIGALHTLVQKQVGKMRLQAPQGDVIQNAGPPVAAGQQPDYQTDGWGADARAAVDLNKNSLDGDTPVSRARLNDAAPRKLYDAGYNYIIANDYTSAEATFKSFLRNYPRDELSGNAQYWLGETYFARSEYRKAANEFLKGYKTYRSSQKAPDNLLKLGMSLHRLGQSEAACQTYAELGSKFKGLPGNVARRLLEEKKQAGC